MSRDEPRGAERSREEEARWAEMGGWAKQEESRRRGGGEEGEGEPLLSRGGGVEAVVRD